MGKLSHTARTDKAKRSFRTAGLFAGIGGIELGLERSGHKTDLLCEIDPACQSVLKDRFGGQPHSDVTNLNTIPDRVELVSAGFPCQDLSQAGETKGISGARSGLVGEVFRLIEKHHTPWVLLENVPFMLQLARGKAMDVIVTEFERLGYEWAYRVVDSRCFGLPQRRRRVYFVAALREDPRSILFSDEAAPPNVEAVRKDVACGFYWTEGIRGLGWGINCVPTLKGGSTIGIPSPPAIVLPSGELCKPDLRDAERLQGFDANWTEPAEIVGRRSARWKLVGNAVSVPAAAWIGERLAASGPVLPYAIEDIQPGSSWPNAAWSCEGRRIKVFASEWPRAVPQTDLLEFLQYPLTLLSKRATAGFLSRTNRSSLNFPDGFIESVERHLLRMEREGKNLVLFEPHGKYEPKVANA